MRKVLGRVAIAFLILLIFAGALFLSWLLTCGIIKAICACFSLTFTWKVATGIWLVLLLLSSIFTGGGN